LYGERAAHTVSPVPAVIVEAGASIAYEVVGNGPPIVFIQGVGVPASGWRPQLDGMAERCHCASIDNRGMGASSPAPGELRISQMAADALAVMDDLGWSSAHVVGHSVGGLVAQELALVARPRVRSLTLMCTFLRGPQAARMEPWIVWTGLRTYLGTRRMRRRAFLEIVLSAEERRTRDLDAEAARLGQLFGRDLADASPMAMRQLRAAAKYDASGRLAALAGLPTLVLSGAHDRLALSAYGRALAAAIPGAVFREADAAHGLPLTRQQEVNDLLVEHVLSAERGLASK
jgi:pimeloyl-ACP methyl ester carboxylesterase